MAAAGRPRDAAVSAAIIEATLDLIAEEGFAGLNVDVIAARAGTTKTTVYRRWAAKEELVAVALDHAFSESLPVPDTGSLREDLIRLNEDFSAVFGTRQGRILVALVSEALRDDKWSSVLSDAQRTSRARTMTVIDRAIERGELAPDADGDLLIDLIYGPLWSHGLVWRDITTRPRNPQAIVDSVLDGFRPARVVKRSLRRAASVGFG